MDLNSIVSKLRKWLTASRRSTPASPPLGDNGEKMERLLRMIANTDEIELSCDEVYEILDQYVELEIQGEDVAHLFPLVKRHLERCRDCFEEYQALFSILKIS